MDETPAKPAFLTTREVADLLRVKERKIYDLAAAGEIPCRRLTGKLLFPRAEIEAWLSGAAPWAVANAVAGSHDPLLDWAVKESDCGLAILACGSRNGLAHLVDGRAVMAGMHLRDEEAGDYNIPAVKHSGLHGVVVVTWAHRRQGLVTAPGNPLSINGIGDLKTSKAKVIERQDGAGSFHLLRQMLAAEGMAAETLNRVKTIAKDETDLAVAVRDGKADAGLAIEAVARQFRLGFVPLVEERYDLVLRRRDYFEAPVQSLLALARTPAFKQRAYELGGYDISDNGTVVFNGP
jgi:excisionase family DNA binding protein